MFGQIVPDDTTRLVLQVCGGQFDSRFAFGFYTFAGNGDVGQQGIGETDQMQDRPDAGV